MANRYTKNTLFSRKSVMLGLVFVLLVAVLSCGHFQVVSHLTGTAGAECNKTIFLASHNLSRDNTLLTLFLLSAIVFTILLRRNIVDQRQWQLNAFWRPSPIFLKATQFVFKLYNPILQAFRRGILHPQIYSFAIITD